MNLIKPFLILELNYGSRQAEIEVLKQLTKIPFLSVKGSYKGTTNNAYLFPLTSSHGSEAEDLIEIARMYQQESVLIVDANGLGSLYFIKDNNEVLLGKWVETVEPITKLEAYTQINNQTFVVR